MKIFSPACLVIVGLALASNTAGIKRKASKDVQESSSKHPRVYRDPFNLYLPEDVFYLIFNFCLSSLNLERTHQDPVTRFKAISKAWNGAISTPRAREIVKRNGRYNVLCLKRDYLIQNSVWQHAKDSIDMNSAVELLTNFNDLDHLLLISSLPCFRGTENLSIEVLAKHVEKGLNSGKVSRWLFTDITGQETLSDVWDSLVLFRGYPEATILSEIPVESLLQAAILEDCLDPAGILSIFVFFSQQVAMFYQARSSSSLIPFYAVLNHVFLPRSGDNFLVSSLCNVIFLAAYIGNIGFIKNLGLDFDQLIEYYSKEETTIRNNTLNYRELLVVCKGIIDEEYHLFPASRLPNVIGILSNLQRISFDDFRLHRRSQCILENDQVSGDIKDIVRNYLNW